MSDKGHRAKAYGDSPAGVHSASPPGQSSLRGEVGAGSPVIVDLQIDVAPFRAALEGVLPALPALEEGSEVFLRLEQLVADGGLVQCHFEPAEGAGHLRCVCKPSEGFAELIAALRAGEAHGQSVKGV